jgi:hypothetical protein
MKSESTQKAIFDKLKNTLLSSALNISKPIYDNFSMTLSRKIALYNLIAIEDYNHLEMGLGIKALEKINKNQEIMTIPIISGLNGMEMLDIKSDQNLQILKKLIHNIAESYAQNLSGKEEEYESAQNKDFKKPKAKIDEFKYEKMLQTQSLTWQIIVNSLHKDSYNYDLVNSFPKEELTQLAYFDRNILEKMSSASLKFFYSETIGAFKYIYDQIAKEGIFELSQENFLWAYNNTLSRKISIIDHYSNVSDNSDKGSPIELIAPIVEYINHSSSVANVFVEPDYDFDSKQSIIRLYAAENISEGDQLLLDYTKSDKFNNRQLMNRYGFFDKDNPNKNIEVPFLMEDVFNLFNILNEEIFMKFFKLQKNENLKNFKIELLRKAKLSDYENKFFKLTLYDNRFDLELLKYLRIAFLAEEDLNDAAKKANLLNFDFSIKFSDENERLVIMFCLGVLNNYFDNVKGNDYAKITGDIGKVESRKQFMLKNMYLLENEEKFLLEKSLKFLKKKLNTLI